MSDPQNLKESKTPYFKVESGIRSFLLINDKEQVQVKDTEEFVQNLKCGNNEVRVVSMVGRVGVSSTYALNHMFFKGQNIFQAVPSQESCTVGVWAAYCPSSGIIVVDTKGLLRNTSNPNRSARMLLQMLAISDIIICRSQAARTLIQDDVLSTLGDAASAFTKLFPLGLKEGHCNVNGLSSVSEPALIIFHETQCTGVLTKPSGMEPEQYLKHQFHKLGFKLDAFCNLQYVGIHSKYGTTDFKPLKEAISKYFEGSVRVARSPAIIFNDLKILNDKFCGKNYVVPNTIGSQPEKNYIAQNVIDVLATVSGAFSSLVFAPIKIFKNLGAGQPAPSFSTPDFQTEQCGICAYVFTDDQVRHRCRKCAGVFCNDCACQKIVPVWGESSPVCVCKKCFQEENSSTVQSLHNPTEVAVSQFSEGVYSVLETAFNVAGLAKGIVQDFYQPRYWVSNRLLKECAVCEFAFGPERRVHHCRSCGNGVCERCSRFRKPVPVHGYTNDVRICRNCVLSKRYDRRVLDHFDY